MNPLTVTSTTAEDTLAFELGWDHARYGVVPTLPQAYDSPALRCGLVAGRASAAPRRRAPSRAVQLWLKLRLQAWCEGQSVEPVQVTPRFVQQLEVSHCPITRAPLGRADSGCGDAAIIRVRHDAAYAAGNLAMLSAKAQRASCAITRAQAQQLARRLDADGPVGSGGLGGLTGAQWARVASLASFVEPATHEQACTQPLLVLPPNRLRLFNPAQALQAFVSRQLLAPGWSLRMSRIEALLPAKGAQRSFQTFFHALLPRVLEAGRNLAAHEQRWAIEDAWRQALVQQRWWAFARQLSAAQCEALVVRAHAKRLGQGLLQALDDRAAVDGWELRQPGQVSTAAAVSAAPPRRTPRPEGRWLPTWQPAPRQAVLPLQ
ncbi:MAG: hypothetical protein ABL900_05020 [Burkholderiaceae bacterium]